MLRHTRRLAIPLGAAAASLLAACTAAPPPRPYVVLQPPPRTHPRPHPATAACEPGRTLSEAQKAALFHDFDAWQRTQAAPNDTAARPLPPPGPEQRTAALHACRARSS